MKSWLKFIFIPLISYLLINTLLYLTGETALYIQAKESLIARSLLFTGLLFLNAIPIYLMLKLAPKAPYISTFIYMGILLCAMTAIRNQSADSLMLVEAKTAYFVSFITAVTMLFYFFFKDERFKPKYGIKNIQGTPSSKS